MFLVLYHNVEKVKIMIGVSKRLTGTVCGTMVCLHVIEEVKSHLGKLEQTLIGSAGW